MSKPIGSALRLLVLAWLAGFALVHGAVSSRAAEHEALERKIKRIENGLVPFSPGDPGAARSGERFTLSERMAHYNIPGVSIAVVDSHKIAWAKGYGTRVAGRTAPVTPETIFQAASTTKLLVAALALRFVERGWVELDTDVNAYLRSWKVPENEFTRTEKVTLRRLLTHQSGFNRPEGGFSIEKGRVPTLVQVLAGESPAANSPAAVEFEPGSRWQYSNFDFVVIQLLVEDALATPLAEVARASVFDRLGMASSTLTYPLSPEMAAREIMPHDVEGKPAAPELHPTAVAQGGLLTTPSDLCLLVIELIDAYDGVSNRLLARTPARLMMRTEVKLDPGPFGVAMAQGLGAFVRGEGDDLSFLHPGDNYPGATSWLVGFPALGQGAVIMTNGALGNMLAMEIMAALAAEYGWPPLE